MAQKFQSDGITTRQDVSPDGRLRVDWLPFPDPRTKYELTSWWGMTLFETATESRIGEFEPFDYDWPAAGGIRMRIAGTVVTVAPDLATFSAESDGPAVYPIGELKAWEWQHVEAGVTLARRLGPQPPAPLRLPRWVLWVLGAAVVVGLGLLVRALGWVA